MCYVILGKVRLGEAILCYVILYYVVLGSVRLGYVMHVILGLCDMKLA